jgi:hypothetical protein
VQSQATSQPLLLRNLVSHAPLGAQRLFAEAFNTLINSHM